MTHKIILYIAIIPIALSIRNIRMASGPESVPPGGYRRFMTSKSCSVLKKRAHETGLLRVPAYPDLFFFIDDFCFKHHGYICIGTTKFRRSFRLSRQGASIAQDINIGECAVKCHGTDFAPFGIIVKYFAQNRHLSFLCRVPVIVSRISGRFPRAMILSFSKLTNIVR